MKIILPPAPSLSQLTTPQEGSRLFAQYLCATFNSVEVYHHLNSRRCSSVQLSISFNNTITESESESSSLLDYNNHQNRDLIRRNFDTATTAIHPSVDPRNVRIEFVGQNEILVVVGNDENDTSVIDSLFARKYLQYSVAGRCFCLASPLSSSSVDDVEDNNTFVASIEEIQVEKPEKLLKAIYKNRILEIEQHQQQEGTTSTNDEPQPENPSMNTKNNSTSSSSRKQLWLEAAEMVRLMYSMKGNNEIISEPGGITLVNVRIVGKCSRFLYFGVCGDDDNDDDNNKMYYVVGFVAHCNMLNDIFGDDADNEQQQRKLFPCTKCPPQDRVSLALLENGNAQSLPRPLREISWIPSKDYQNQQFFAQVVSYRAVIVKDPKFSHFSANNNNKNKKKNASSTQEENEEEEDQDDDDDGSWIQRVQLEDSYLLKIYRKSDDSSSNTTSNNNTSVYALKKLLAGLNKHNTIQGTKGRGGMSSVLSPIAKAYLKKICDPKMNFTFQDKRDLNRERRCMDQLFRGVLGRYVASGLDFNSNKGSVMNLLLPTTMPNNNHNIPRLCSFPDETQQVEFKQQLHQYDNNNNNNNNTNNSKANIERARRILAAFANTRGGMLMVGVNDDGELVGVETNNSSTTVVDENILPRSTGFIPSMIQNAVLTTRINLPRVQQQQQQQQSPQQQQPVQQQKPAMDWWKKKSGGSTSTTSTQQQQNQQQIQQQQQQTPAPAALKSIFVMTVMKGAAPFYSTPGPALPPVRGQASTLLLSVTNMAERLMSELIKLDGIHHSQQQQQQEELSQRRERE